MRNINSTPGSFINHNTMLLQFVKNSKRSIFNDAGKSFRTTAKTVFQVGVTSKF